MKALLHLDTRALDLMLGAMSIVWAIGGMLEPAALLDTTTSFGRVEANVDLHLLGPFLILTGAGLVGGALKGLKWVRRMFGMLSIFWWAWLASLMFQFPPSHSAAFVYSVLVAFSCWSFVSSGQDK